MSQAEKIQAGDFVRVTNSYMWKDSGFFKNALWVLNREPVRVKMITGESIVVERNDQLFSPIPVSCVEIVWRPAFSIDDDAVLQDDVGDIAKGTRGVISEHFCLSTGSSNEFEPDVQCFYGWKPVKLSDPNTSVILEESHLTLV